MGLPRMCFSSICGVFYLNFTIHLSQIEKLEHAHDGKVLQVRFPQPVAASGVSGESPAETAIVVEYVIRDPLKGMTFSPPVPGVDGGPPKAAEVHTQGQPESNRGWFPIHDFPNIRLATELRVEVPRGVSVSGNGKLVKHEVTGDRERWQWLQSRPDWLFDPEAAKPKDYDHTLLKRLKKLQEVSDPQVRLDLLKPWLRSRGPFPQSWWDGCDESKPASPVT